MSFTASHEKRLRHLIGSWSLRARPGMPGQQPQLLLQNIEAVDGALAAIQRSAVIEAKFKDAVQTLSGVKRSVRHLMRRGKPTRADLIALSRKIDNALTALEDQL